MKTETSQKPTKETKGFSSPSFVPSVAFCSRPLPRNIYPNTGGGYVVRVTRAGVKLVSCTADLARAIAIRDQFIQQHGDVKRIARSNTGLLGITEVTKWHHSRAYPCFQVTTRHPKHGDMKRFFYSGGGSSRLTSDLRPLTSRRDALRAAAAHRARLTGERITDQQIEEALAHV
jgi:hypothetical protein